MGSCYIAIHLLALTQTIFSTSIKDAQTAELSRPADRWSLRRIPKQNKLKTWWTKHFSTRRMFVPWWKASGLQWGTGLAVASCLCLQPILGMWWESPGKNTGTGTRRRKFAGSLSIWRLSCATGIWLSQGRVCTVLKAWTKWASLAHLRALCWLALIRMGSDTQSSSFLRTKETWPFVLSGSQPGHLTAAEKSFQW